MEWFWFVIVLVLCYGVGGLTGWALAARDYRRHIAEHNLELVRRPVERRDDAVVVTRDPGAPRSHSRVSTGHMSQPRPYWRSEDS